ncbi:hypothetical protein KL931_005125 [Ogataea haglerorum]|nr:hypothetical protein KL931_005125 [Ogataea haglerorum]
MGAKVLALGRDKATLEKLASHYSNVQPVLLTGDKEADAATLQKLGPLDAYMDYTPSGAAGPVYLDAAIGALRFGGRVILSGLVFANLSIPYGLVVAKDLTIKGKFMYSRQEAKDFLKMVENGIFKMDHVRVRKYPIDQYAEAADVANGKAPWDELVAADLPQAGGCVVDELRAVDAAREQELGIWGHALALAKVLRVRDGGQAGRGALDVDTEVGHEVGGVERGDAVVAQVAHGLEAGALLAEQLDGGVLGEAGVEEVWVAGVDGEAEAEHGVGDGVFLGWGAC